MKRLILMLVVSCVPVSGFASSPFERQVLKRLIADSETLTLADPEYPSKKVTVNGLLARWLLDPTLKFGELSCQEDRCLLRFHNAQPDPTDIENGDFALGFLFKVKTSGQGGPKVVPGSFESFAAG